MAESIYAGYTVFTATTGSIQSYVFATNRLKDNAGASELARLALEYWASVPQPAEVIFVGGGNAAVLFPPGYDWKTLVYEWSRDWLTGAPGLRLVTAAATVEESDRLGDAIRRAQKRLREREDAAPFGQWPAALPVVRTCSASGGPASKLLTNEDGRVEPLSNVVAAKRRAVDDANAYLADRYGDMLGQYEFPTEFERMAGEDGASHIAIVHADGNGIGKLFTEALLDRELNDQALIVRLQGLAEDIKTVAGRSFSRLLNELVDLMPLLKEEKVVRSGNYLPLRPIVEAGDDLTFVCHGRLGLYLTVRYLRIFEEESDHRWTACAGVMIQPQKFPFARGYDHAADLTSSAKKARLKHIEGNEAEDGSWLDFQAIYEGAQSDLKATRSSLYGDSSKRLLRRPYALSIGPDGANWSDFTRYRRMAAGPGVPRSRAKELLGLARQGTSAMKAVKPMWNLAGPELEPLRALLDQAPQDFWDALEMLDLYWEPKTNGH